MTEGTQNHKLISSMQSTARNAYGIEKITVLRWVMIVSLPLTIGALYQMSSLAFELGVIPGSWKWTSALVVTAIGVVVEFAFLIGSWTRWRIDLIDFVTSLPRILGRHNWLNILVFAVLMAIFPILVLGRLGQHLEGYWVRSFMMWILALVGATLLFRVVKERTWFETLLLSLLFYTVVYRASLFIPWISTFPFSLGYSEGSRYYFASLFFGERIYGLPGLELPVFHPSRYVLQSIPFLIRGSPLWLHRTWQVFLWIAMTFITSLLLARRLSIQDKFHRVIFLPWAFLFLLQAPVYYHLLVMVVLVIWGTNSRNFIQTLIIVIVTSVWAGISRINWVPVPGMLASTLYFLEICKLEDWSLLRYLRSPLIWLSLGSSAAFGSNLIYQTLVRGPINWLSSIQDSPLFWYRLLPSATYKLGVLPAILIASVPLSIIIVSNVLRRPHRWHPIRILSLGAILGVLFIGGLVVSTKIGGGDDLHNLDAFLVHLMLIGTYMIFNKFQRDRDNGHPLPWPSWQMLSLIIAVPILFFLGLGGPISSPDNAKADIALLELKEIVTEATAKDGEVLFISDRHLLTFHLVEGIQLVPEYEKTFLMEMAMSGNQAYFDVFNRDLKSHRFDLIVVNPQHIKYKGRDHTFGEEDDAWVRYVSTSLLEYYQNKTVLNADRELIAVMEPRP
jgi:hypothetical protein